MRILKLVGLLLGLAGSGRAHGTVTHHPARVRVAPPGCCAGVPGATTTPENRHDGRKRKTRGSGPARPREASDVRESTLTTSRSRATGFDMELTAVYIQVPEGYIAFVEELPGANTQGATLDEARENLKEAVQLVLEANRELTERSLVGQRVSKERFAVSVA